MRWETILEGMRIVFHYHRKAGAGPTMGTLSLLKGWTREKVITEDDKVFL